MKKTILLLMALFIQFFAHAQKLYDVVIKNGRLIDGSGNPWYYTDVAIKDGKIVAIGKIDALKADKVLDATGMTIAPGFIDVHTHIEGDERKVPTAESFIYDGVTTVITGNCGSSEVNLHKYFGMVDSLHTSINVASFIGHNDVRKAVMGTAQRDPSAEEQQKMEALVEQAMKDGAVGFSTGLLYVPGTYSKTPEVIGLAKASAKYGGVYTSHMRSESDKIFEAIKETIDIGRAAKMPVEISHFKVGKPNWGRTAEMIKMVEDARKEGLDVTVDQYPYTASSTSLSVMIPSWALAGGRDSSKVRINDPASRKLIVKEMLSDLKLRQRKHYDYAVVAHFKADTALNGKSITEITRLKGKGTKTLDEINTILDMQINGGAGMVFHGLDENDVKSIMQYPYTMVASDASIRVFGDGVPHPRGYGSNARVLGRYVREQHVLRLEDAIRKMTSLPAQKFGFKDRGLIKEGMAADIVVFDADKVLDLSTYNKPHQYSTGFKYVLVNGRVIVDEFKHTGTRSGKVLYGPGYIKN